MNHIHRITTERDDSFAQMRAVRDALCELEIYLTSRKFQSVDNDYVFVSTDVLPKIAAIRFLAIG
jgi:hypothetical protein